jgi:hypothetical protein
MVVSTSNMPPVDIKLNITFRVVAYDSGGYGDNRSRDFSNGADAVEYARSLEPRFGATVWKTVTMEPLHMKIWPEASTLTAKSQ